MLRAGNRLALTEFDGNPIGAAHLAGQPRPAAVDVAGLVQSIDHAGRVAIRRSPDHTARIESLIAASCASLLDAYRAELDVHGRTEELLDERLLVPLRYAQELHELVYADRHLPRWTYAPLASGVAEGVGWAPDPATLVIGISATGGSTETLDAMDVHVDRVGPERVLAVTNVADSPITERAAHVLEMHAGVEEGGVACRTYRHTIAVLLTLAERLASDRPTSPSIGAPDTAIAVRRAAAATEYLLDRSDAWLPDVLAALDSPDGTWVLAPAARLASAQQASLMIREGPRRRAEACETGDWSHIDVYLTKTLDYRALVYTGSRYDAAAADWMTRRRSTGVAVGGSFPDARHEVRYPGDDQPDVALLTEVLVAELVAATWWADTATSATTP